MDFDVVIIGAAFSGASTGLLLKRHNPAWRVLIIEKSDVFDRKVGESTTEVGARYFAHIIGMKDHLDEEQIHKFGLRFFLSDGKNDDIARRIEMGIPFIPPDPSFQIDRG